MSAAVLRSRKRQLVQSFLLAGVIPVVAFSLIEEYYGTVWGLIAGMVFGVGEVIYEWCTQGRVDAITWGGNGLLLLLGGISLVTQEGIFFKLQPALIEAAMALALWVSAGLGKPLLVGIMRKQLQLQGALQPLEAGGAPELPPVLVNELRGMTWRIGFFFSFHAALATWAAFHWTTAAWALLKGVGFTLSMILYMVAESFLLRYRIASRK